MASINSHLSHLEKNGLVKLGQVEPELEYLFRHALVQETAYRSILRHERELLHLHVGEFLAANAGDRLEDMAAMLAYHYAAAGVDQKAFEYYSMAGDAAKAVYANPEAIGHYQQAIETAKNLKDVPSTKLTEIYLDFGRTLEISGDYDRALNAYEDMEALAVKSKDEHMRLESLVARATVHSAPTNQFDDKKGKAISEQSLKLAEKLNEKESQAKIYWNLLLLLGNTGKTEEALTYGEKSLKIAREENLKSQMAYTLHDMANANLISGRAEKGYSLIQEAEKLWRELGNTPMLTDSLTSQALMSIILGESGKTLELTSEAFNLSESINNPWGQSYALYADSSYHLLRGEFGIGIEKMKESIRYGEQADFIVPLVELPAFISFIYLDFGNAKEAKQWLDKSLEGLKGKSLMMANGPLAVKARYHMLNGENNKAEELIINLLEDPNFFPSPGRFLGFWIGGDLFIDDKKYSEALNLSKEFAKSVSDLGFKMFTHIVLYIEGRARHGLGELEKAKMVLDEAREMATKKETRRMLLDILPALQAVEEELGNDKDAKKINGEAKKVVEFIAKNAGNKENKTGFLKSDLAKRIMGK